MELSIQVIVEFNEEDGLYLAHVPQLNDLATFGETEEEALENMKDALRLYFKPIDLNQFKNKTHVHDMDLRKVIPA